MHVVIRQNVAADLHCKLCIKLYCKGFGATFPENKIAMCVTNKICTLTGKDRKLFPTDHDKSTCTVLAYSLLQLLQITLLCDRTVTTRSRAIQSRLLAEPKTSSHVHQFCPRRRNVYCYGVKSTRLHGKAPYLQVRRKDIVSRATPSLL